MLRGEAVDHRPRGSPHRSDTHGHGTKPRCGVSTHGAAAIRRNRAIYYAWRLPFPNVLLLRLSAQETQQASGISAWRRLDADDVIDLPHAALQYVAPSPE
jgi:hypothetical protein